MKSFIRTVFGKTLIFVLCIVSMTALALCTIGAVFAFESGVYYTPESTLTDNSLHSAISSECSSIIYRSEASSASPMIYPTDGTNLRAAIYNEKNELIAISEGCSESDDWKYTIPLFYAEGFDDGEGNYTEIQHEYTVKAYLADGLPVKDEFAMISRLVHLGYSMRFAIYPVGLASLALMIATFVCLMTVSGRRPDDDELHPTSLIRIPSDVVLLLAIAASVFGIAFICDGLNSDWLIIPFAVVILNIALGLAMSFAVRIKLGTLFSNTLIWRILWILWRLLCLIWRGVKALGGLIGEALRGLHITWRLALLLTAISVFELVLLANCDASGAVVLLWLIEKLAVFVFVIRFALSLRKLEKAGEKLAGGDVAAKFDFGKLPAMLVPHSENLCSIADGINTAVEERIKSERLKTELITNVSHDIKTPLTSIINYSDLIGREKCDNPQITEYAEVLGRQSVRLKRLIDDLVEASKASTGTLDVQLAPCDVSVLLAQAAGEYRQRLTDSGLELVINEPEGQSQISVLADGRRLWRVFDNLLSNICKYSLNGTRVYITLEKLGKNAVISFKNISRESLNISPDELMERFVRGDRSRSAEGNGLGLSIARSMTELQGGTLSIAIDGDLFKAAVTLPVLE